MTDFTVIVTAIDETESVRVTVGRLVADNRADLAGIIMATAPKTTAACRAAIAEMVERHPGLVTEHEQSRLPGLGGALQECAALVTSPWTIFMAADLETPPERVAAIIERAKQGDVDIVATSRWLAGGDFGDYSRTKLVCNWIFQRSFSLLYGTRLTDMTYGFRAYRTPLLQRYRWEETGHAFFMEALCKPLRDGKRIVEVPVRWRKRIEGASHIVASEFARYFRIGLACRVRPVRGFLRSAAD